MPKINHIPLPGFHAIRYVRRGFNNLTGRLFGRLTVYALAGSRGQAKHWFCRCACGMFKTVAANNLISAHSTSCGCGREEAKWRHGLARTQSCSSWYKAISRCFDPDCVGFDDWGGRGITVCLGWQDVVAFCVAMGEPPTIQHSLDRIDNNGNYSCGECAQCVEKGWPMNCRWATKREQALNRRNTRLVEFNGRTLALVEWAEEVAINKATLYSRLKNGWTVERALTTPALNRP